MRLKALFFILLLVLNSLFAGQSQHHSYKTTVVTDGLSYPWGMAFLPNGDVIITEKSGDVRIVKSGKLAPKPLSGVPEAIYSGQGGMLDVKLHPAFDENRLVYLSYAGGTRRGWSTHVARGRLNNNATGLENVEVIFEAKPLMTTGFHFGSRLAFDNDGYLYITLGDRGQMNEAQNLKNHQGTTVRLHDDGRIPIDNPFVNNNKALPEIFTYGNRNVQGVAKHPITGEIWAHEHGPKGGDEINILKSGKNYGWPVITYGVDYSGAIISNKTHQQGMEQPILHWTPSIAPCGMTFYTGDKFPEWQNDIFVGALAKRHLRRVKLDGTRVVEQEKLLTELNARVRDVEQGTDGNLYILTDEPNGRLIRISP